MRQLSFSSKCRSPRGCLLTWQFRQSNGFSSPTYLNLYVVSAINSNFTLLTTCWIPIHDLVGNPIYVPSPIQKQQFPSFFTWCYLLTSLLESSVLSDFPSLSYKLWNLDKNLLEFVPALLFQLNSEPFSSSSSLPNFCNMCSYIHCIQSNPNTCFQSEV